MAWRGIFLGQLVFFCSTTYCVATEVERESKFFVFLEQFGTLTVQRNIHNICWLNRYHTFLLTSFVSFHLWVVTNSKNSKKRSRLTILFLVGCYFSQQRLVNWSVFILNFMLHCLLVLQWHPRKCSDRNDMLFIEDMNRF